MNHYEVAVLYDPGLEADLGEPEAKVNKLLTSSGAKIIKTDNWGSRKLAYRIKSHDSAVYVFYTLEAPAEAVSVIESGLNIMDGVIRYLIVRPDLKAEAKARQQHEDKAKKAAERAATGAVSEQDNTAPAARRGRPRAAAARQPA